MKLGGNGEECIKFIHGGHKGLINDFAWNTSDELNFLSLDSHNSLHVWKPNEEFFFRNDE